MKKTLSYALALVMCLSLLVSIPAAAYGDNWIQLAKSNFDPNEEIIVTVSGITARMVEDSAYVSIYKKGAAHDEYGEWYRPEQGTSQLKFTAPVESGDYEMRLYKEDYTYRAEDLVTSVPFTVGQVSKVGNISLDKAAYTAFDAITVTVTGITEQMVTAEAFIAVYEKGAKHGEWGEYVYMPAGSSTQTLHAPNKNGEYEIRLYTTNRLYTDETFVTAAPFTVSGATGSDWAQDELTKANNYGLIPDSLKGQDLSKPITRAEFAAVSVKLYENLTDTKATPAANNPFTDTGDAEVLKAYNVGITSGTAADKFSPDVLLSREQAATMLTRVLKASYIPGWTLATDNSYTLNFTQPAKFGDDDKISDWAKPSVYFMATNKIISGTGNNMFSPRATTAAEEAALYASATREQALAISVRIVDNLKDKPIDYAKDGEEKPSPEPPSGEIDTDLVGKWGGAVSGYEQHRYWFKDDGTYLYRITMLPNIDFDINTAQNIYERGTWSLSEGVVYLTQNYRAYFSLRGKPPETLEWEVREDCTMHIRFGVHDTIYADYNYLGERYFDNLDQESIFWDVKSPDGYLRLTYNNVPDWVFP